MSATPIHPRSHQRLASLLALAVATAACAPPEEGTRPAPGALSVFDSAGVRIVELPAGALEALPEWRIADEPLVTIGVEFGEEPYMFSAVAGAFVRSDGSIVVADQRAREIRLFDSAGAFLTKSGRDGDGPGEFGRIDFVGPLPDGGTFVLDNRLRRASRLDARGEFIESYPWEVEQCDSRLAMEGGLMCRVLTILPTGDPFLELDHRLPQVSGPELQIAEPGWVLVGALRSGIVEVVDSVQRASMVTGPIAWEGSEIRFTDEQPFAARGLIAVGGGVIVSARGEAFELLTRDLAGTLIGITRADVPARPVTDDHIERFISVQRTDVPTHAIAELVLDRLEPADSIPHFDELRVDDVGRTWVREYNYGYADVGPVRWWIFGEDGLPLATLEASWRHGGALSPMLGFPKIIQIGEDFILALERDELDVERVAVYRIERQEA